MTKMCIQSASNTFASESNLTYGSGFATDCCSYDLPKDVFVEGETRPTRKKTKKNKEATSASDAKSTHKKRSLSNAGFDVSSQKAHKMIALSTNSG